jgi:5-methylthioadenosine/S-adenosylhomocysteine deaminase
MSATPPAQSAIRGRIVTMDAAGTVIPDGVVYIAGTRIAAVQPASAPAPAGFEAVRPLRTAGTVYPGMIELHNHLSYNCLRLWQVPRRFSNRGQWSVGPDYRRLISGPMQVIGKTPTLVPSLVRYVEAKCLVAGVTTSQGIALASDAGIRTFYKGVVRNCEAPDDPALQTAASRISDVAAKDVMAFAAELARDKRLLLHLAEGTDDPARSHFTALQEPDGSWAISNHLIGIHSVGLHPEDIPGFAQAGGQMVWSPLSNLLLYGATAHIDVMKANGVPIGLGSDWSPSGSKNLLGELKVARLVSRTWPGGAVFTDAELVAMVTRSAAAMLGWDGALGTLEAGKLADLVAVSGTSADPYSGLIDATERDIVLVMIGGVGRVGQPHLIAPFTADAEAVSIGGRARVLNLAGGDANVGVEGVTLADATEALGAALATLPQLARDLEPAIVAAGAGGVMAEARQHGTTLALDEIEHTPDEHMRMDPPGGVAVVPPAAMQAAAPPLSTVLGPLELDGLTVDDDPAYLETLQAEANLPDGLAAGIAAAYAKVPA